MTLRKSRFVSSCAPLLRATVVTLLVAAPCWFCPWSSPAAAQLQTPQFEHLVPIGDFQVRIDGEVVPNAKIYRGARPPAFLIMTPALPAPTLLVPGQRGQVMTLNLMKLAKRGDGSIDVLPGAILASQGSFEVDGQALDFTVEGKKVRVEEKPPLLGLHGASELKSYSANYEEGAADYTPDAGLLSQLKSEQKPVRVRIFFGSWCPLCSRTVPHIVRIADELKGTQIDFEFYGLPRGFGDDPEAAKHGVTAVPTGIVFVEGEEAGRIQGNGWLRPEQVLQDILSEG